MRGFPVKDYNVVIERLLSISGEDTLTINRKHRDQWTGKLPSRIMILSNELPRLGDASQAIVGRLVLLLLTKSWLGKEDHSLESNLHQELPGILNWALDGLERLTVTNNNSFTHVAATEETVLDLHELASPVAAFVRENCVLGADKKVEVNILYHEYGVWCGANGHVKSSKQIFGRNLRAAFPAVKVERPRSGQAEARPRSRRYLGITLTILAQNPQAPFTGSF
jgi:putative DNA primase/helicase